MYKKILLIFICFYLFHTIPVCAQQYVSYGNGLSNSDATDYPFVTHIEEKNLGRNYAGENIYSRINRLEGTLLGSTFPNDALCDRLDRLTKISATSPDDDIEEEDYYARNNKRFRDYNGYMGLAGSRNSYSGYNNSSYDNYHRGTSNSLIKSLINDILIPVLTGDNYYNRNNNPYYYDNFDLQEDLYFGSSARILDDY